MTPVRGGKKLFKWITETEEIFFFSFFCLHLWAKGYFSWILSAPLASGNKITKLSRISIITIYLPQDSRHLTRSATAFALENTLLQKTTVQHGHFAINLGWWFALPKCVSCFLFYIQTTMLTAVLSHDHYLYLIHTPLQPKNWKEAIYK